MSISDRIVVMGGGEILQVGSPRELYDEPADVRVAQFLGRTNVFDAQIVDKQGLTAHVKIEGVDSLFPCRIPGCAKANSRGTLSVRPEAVSVHAATAAGDRLPGRVTTVMYLGNFTQIRVRLDIGQTIEVQQMTTQVWNVGDAVDLSFDAERCYFIAGEDNNSRFAA